MLRIYLFALVAIWACDEGPIEPTGPKGDAGLPGIQGDKSHVFGGNSNDLQG